MGSWENWKRRRKKKNWKRLRKKLRRQQERPRAEALPKDRLLARQLGVDMEQVRGTGPKGRITEDDIRKFAGQGIPEKGAREPEGAPGQDNWGAVTRVPLRGVRRKIAQAMTESITKAAQVLRRTRRMRDCCR